MVSSFRHFLCGCVLIAASTTVFAASAGHRSPASATERTTVAAAPTPAAETATETTTGTPAQEKTTKGYRIAAPKDETAPVPLQGQLLPSIQYAVQDIFFLSPPQFPPILNNATTIHEGQAILAVPLLRRYAISEAGDVDLSYRLTVLQPDGGIEEMPEPMTIFKGKITNPETLIFPTANIPAFKTGKTQSPGTYTLRLDIRDAISKEHITLEQAIEVIPYEVPALPEDFDSDKWMERYYQSPQPELALPALYAMMENISNERLDSVTPPMLGFYNQVLADNPWLLPHFSVKLEEALGRSRKGGEVNNADILLGLILSFHLRKAETRPETISETIWLETESNRQFDWGYTDPYATPYIYYPHQLDYLWGQFMANGAYRPVYRLLEALLQDTEAAAEAAPQSVRKLPPEQQSTLREAVRQATRWSLISNARQHRQILAYLIGILLNERNGLSQEDREQLRLVLAVATRPQTDEQPQADTPRSESAETHEQTQEGAQPKPEHQPKPEQQPAPPTPPKTGEPA